MKSGYPKIIVTRATNATRVRPEDYSTDVTTSLTKPTKGKFEVRYPKINVTRATNATRVRPEDYSTDVTTSLSKPTKGKYEVGIIDFKS